jgi:hypothetical protein
MGEERTVGLNPSSAIDKLYDPGKAIDFWGLSFLFSTMETALTLLD